MDEGVGASVLVEGGRMSGIIPSIELLKLPEMVKPTFGIGGLVREQRESWESAQLRDREDISVADEQVRNPMDGEVISLFSPMTVTLQWLRFR